MGRVRYWSKSRQTALSRRRLIVATATGGASLALVRCSSRSKAGSHAIGGSSPGQAAAETPRAGGTLNTFIPVNPASLDPQRTKSIPAISVASHVMSRLFRHKTGLDPTVALSMELENDLAASAESPDGLTWTVKLRPDAKFQNIAPVSGHAVEAEDVKATFERALTDPKSTAKIALLMMDANQIEAPVQDTVVFKLRYPYGPFQQTLTDGTASWVFPREALAGAYDPAKRAIGSGPFVLDSYAPDVALDYRRNPAWFERGRPYIDGEHTTIVPNTSQQVAQFSAGHLDELPVTQTNLDAVKRAVPGATVVTSPEINPYYIYGHMDEPASPYRDARVRQALSLAIDRAAIGKVVFNGQYHNNGVLPSWRGPWAVAPDQLGDASKYFTYNLAEAKQLLAASGAAGQIHQLVYPSPAHGPEFDTIAQMINPMLNAAGFKMELVAVDYEREFLPRIAMGKYPIDTLVFTIQFGGTSIPEVALFNNLVPGATNNHAHVDDPTLTSMCTKMIGTLNDSERLKRVQEIQRYEADKMYYIFGIPTGNQYTLIQPKVRGYAYSLDLSTAGTETYAKLWLAA